MSEQGFAYKDIVIPDFVMKRIELLANKKGVPREQLLEQYYQIFKDPWVQNDPQFKSDYERHAYAIRKLWVTVLSRPPSKEVYVIPFGVAEARMTRTGKLQSRIYVLVKRSDKWEKAVLICQDREAGLWEQVQLFYAYKIRVYDPGGQALFAVPETNFDEPLQPIPGDPIDFLQRFVGVKKFKLADVNKHITRRIEVGGRMVLDEFDIHGLSAIVLRYKKGKRSDGTEYAFYIVSDDSIGLEDELDEEGNLIPAQFTVWVPPTFLKYDVDSELFLYGHVQRDRDGRPFMNAIGVIPIHAKRIEV